MDKILESSSETTSASSGIEAISSPSGKTNGNSTGQQRTKGLSRRMSYSELMADDSSSSDSSDLEGIAGLPVTRRQPLKRRASNNSRVSDDAPGKIQLDLVGDGRSRRQRNSFNAATSENIVHGRRARTAVKRDDLVQPENTSRKRTKRCSGCGASMLLRKVSNNSRWAASVRACEKGGWKRQHHLDYVLEQEKKDQEKRGKLQGKRRFDGMDAHMMGQNRRKNQMSLSRDSMEDSFAAPHKRQRRNKFKNVKPYPLRQGGYERASHERKDFENYLPSREELLACDQRRKDLIHWDDSTRTRVGLMPIEPPLGSRFLACAKMPSNIIFRVAITRGRLSSTWNEYLDTEPQVALGTSRRRQGDESSGPGSLKQRAPVRMGQSLMLGLPLRHWRTTRPPPRYSKSPNLCVVSEDTPPPPPSEQQLDELRAIEKTATEMRKEYGLAEMSSELATILKRGF